jgi:hypothetical protein
LDFQLLFATEKDAENIRFATNTKKGLKHKQQQNRGYRKNRTAEKTMRVFKWKEKAL